MDWSFRYEGVPGGAMAAMAKHGASNKERAVPAAVSALVESEIKLMAANSKSVLIAVRGDADQEDAPLRSLSVEISFRD